jgi:hypothetical protein
MRTSDFTPLFRSIVGFDIKGPAMKVSLWAVSLALATIMPFAAGAGELKPLEAGIFPLSAHTVSVYYTVSGDTFEVVTTIAPGADAAGAPIRFVGLLPPGQKQVVSVGTFGTTGAPETLELVHQGGALSATQVKNVAAVN